MPLKPQKCLEVTPQQMAALLSSTKEQEQEKVFQLPQQMNCTTLDFIHVSRQQRNPISQNAYTRLRWCEKNKHKTAKIGQNLYPPMNRVWKLGSNHENQEFGGTMERNCLAPTFKSGRRSVMIGG
ncbi:hypothetical protein G9A89_016875 [Geosiphon pyriformis]|nr:hypothetical protein G9A89_016875 [Geosiphon pyriformis]